MRTRSKSPVENRGPTIHDVARAAGVSTATVSNVLRGTRYVGPDLQKRVQKAIDSLSYTPNQVAASLRERRTRIIGVAVPDITTGLFTEIVRRIEKRAACTDYQIILTDSEENVIAERARIGALIKRKIDGLIVIPCHDDSPVLEDLRRSEIPTVLVDRATEGTIFDSVMADNCLAAREGTGHLISLGHRNIMLLASEAGLRNIKERIKGYREALKEAGISDLENIVVAGANETDFVKPALEQLLRNESRPSAMFAVTQKMTVGALQVVAEAGLVIPKDISFLAFDDCEWFRAMRPFLSTVSQPAEDFADQAWSMLMARLNNDRSPTFRKEVHCTLIVRESTAQYHALPGGRLPEQVGRSLTGRPENAAIVN
jgi:LacI family transcriptional regulator